MKGTPETNHEGHCLTSLAKSDYRGGIFSRIRKIGVKSFGWQVLESR
jgi:hypothetical protein